MLTQQWVEERYARAVVVVVPTRSVDESCNKNGMDLVHLLRPFCAVTDGPLVGRLGEGGERPMEIHNFGVRLQSIRCVAPVSTDRRDAYLTNLVQAFAVMDHAHGEQLDRLIHNELIDHVGGGLRPRPCRLSSTAALAQLMKRGSPPWHSQFSQDLHNLTRCSHSDTLDYPVGSILAVSTADVRGGGLEGVRRAFYQLGNAELSRLREQFPAVEQDLHSFHLLVHDAANPQSPPLEEVQQLLLHAQQVYGLSGCAVICINSIATPALGTTRDPTPWIVASPASRDVVATTQASSSSSATAAANGPTSPAVEVGESLSGLGYHSVRSFFDGRQVTGCHLSDEDTRGLREVMSFYLSQAIFKHMEVKLRLLNSFVQERRTTTFGKITAWFKGKDEPKPQMEVVMPSMPTAQPRYKASSLEMQMRRCGDLSLAMHDYNSAVSYYKMLLDELLSTLPQRSFNRDLIGACQEGIAVAQYLMGKQVLPSTTPWITGSTRSTGRMGSQVCRLEYALHDFLASGSTDFALRVVLLMFEWCRGSRGGAKPAVEVLQYALRLGLAARRPLISGVLHDMIASVYILVNPPIPARDVGMEALSLPEGEAYPVRVYLRQYAHLMVLAGSHYRQGGQNELALRCYLHVMEILRPMARQHSWMPLVEHVGLTVAHLHSAIGQEEKGLAVVCALMAHGSPIYSTPGEKCVVALQRLMAHQAKVMQQLNFSIYTQHPIPCIDRHTFQVYANYYGSDDDTEAPYSVMGVEAVELEWRMVEELLRDHYVASTPIDPSHGRAYRFPRFHGNSRKRAASLFPPSSSSSTCASIQSPDSSPHRRTHSSNPSHSMDSHHAAPPAAAAAGRLFHIHLGEPLLMSFVVRNPLGTTITLEDCCLLYQPTDGDAMLRSASMKAVVLQPLETKRVMIALNLRHVKTYVVVGLSWRLCGHDGYYYFATKESRPGAPESVFEYAMAHTSQQVEAPENVWVVVSPPMARIEAEMDPPLPPTMYDGEYLHTQLRITNRSSKCAAHHVILQRSPHNAHLVWLEDFTMEQNLQSEASLLVAECLQPSASITLSITIRAQHNRGDAAIDCGNHHFFLLGYLPTTISSPTDDASTSAAGSTTSKVVAAPTVRLHRFLRRIRVRPLVAIYSTVLPPANASMAIAAAITAKNISNPRHGSSMLHICRIKTFHAPSWSVSKAFAGTIVSDDGRECYVHQGSSLTIPLLIQRQVRNTNTSDDHDDDDSLVSSTCLSMEEACSTSPHTAEVLANVGDGDDAQHRQRHHFFCRLSYRGAGSVGERSQSKLILYVDGGGKHRATTEEEREREAREAEARQHGAPLVQYTPLVMVVTWAVVEKDEERGSEFVHSGQTFHYIDPMAFLAPPPTSASQGSISSVEPATLTPSQLQHQQLLCAAMVRGVSSPYASRGALVYQVAVAPAVATSEVLPVAAVVPLTIRCLSLAPVPLMVRVAAKAPADIQDVDPRLPLVFVGKTAHHFLLLPSDEHEVRLTAHIMAPGVVDCNHLHVSVVPLRFTPHVCVQSGLSKRDFVLLLCNNNNTSARLEEDSDAALAAVATPAGMLPGAVMVVGDGVPALTYAHFDHLPHATAAAAAFKEKNDVYREDWMRFAAQLRKYEEGIAQRGQGTHNQRYVYRPTVKCLSNSAEDDEQVEEAEEKVGFALGISARLAWLNATNAGGDARQTNAGPSVPLLPLISRSPRPSLVASQTSTLNTATTQLQVVHESAAETVMHVEASVPLFASPIKPRATHTPRPGGQSCAAPSSSLRIDLPATPAAASGVEGAGMHAQGDAGDADDVCGVGEEDFSAGSPLHYPSVQSNHSRSFDFPAGAEEVSITTSTEHSVASPPMASPPRQPPTEEGESELVDAGTTLDASPTSPEAIAPPLHAHFHDPSELASSSMLDP